MYDVRMRSYGSSFGKVELTDERLQHILEFHPEIKGLQKYFATSLNDPHIIKPSKSDPQVYVFYRKITINKFLAVVIKINARNFILTAYITNKLNQNI